MSNYNCRDFVVNEGYLTAMFSGAVLGRNHSNANSHRQFNIGICQFEVGGINNGSFTHTNSDNTTTTITYQHRHIQPPVIAYQLATLV